MSDVLNCPNGHKYVVLESRHRQIGELTTIWRRRRCTVPGCLHQITTSEVPYDLAVELFVDE
jgi:transcriptional regulator NrdR family protein